LSALFLYDLMVAATASAQKQWMDPSEERTDRMGVSKALKKKRVRVEASAGFQPGSDRPKESVELPYNKSPGDKKTLDMPLLTRASGTSRSNGWCRAASATFRLGRGGGLSSLTRFGAESSSCWKDYGWGTTSTREE